MIIFRARVEYSRDRVGEVEELWKPPAGFAYISGLAVRYTDKTTGSRILITTEADDELRFK